MSSRYTTHYLYNNSKTCLKQPLKKKNKNGFQDRFLLNASQNIAEFWSILQYFRPSLRYHFVVKTFGLSIFEWPFYTGFTVLDQSLKMYFQIT